MKSLIIPSPAKLNLFLRVVGKYPDGYHRLVTLFHRISLQDTLRLVKRSQGFSLKCSNPNLPTDESNLITRAYRLLEKEFPGLGGVSVHLTKRIPLESGLGGGSGNAAAFLLGIKKLYRLPVSRKKFIEIGRRLGADVPFFLYNVNQALGLERGDRILPSPFKRPKWFVLVLFNRGLSTKKIYQNFTRQKQPVILTKVSRAVRMTCKFLDRKNLPAKQGFLQNDLTQSAIRLNPRIQKIMAKIEKMGIVLVGMSGSGPTIFAILFDQRQAERLKFKLQQDLPSEKVIVCHSF